MRKRLLGSYDKDGLIMTIVLYILLIGISFIFLYPLLQMIVTSFMPLIDLVDPTTIWIPKNFTIENYRRAITSLNFWVSLKDSFIVTIFPTIAIVFSSALIGFGFATYDFPFKKILLASVLLVFFLPSILMSIPTYVIYRNLNIIGSLKTYLYPALTGFGIRQTIFILIFYQFFKMIPNELKEAAEVDGANAFKVFTHVAIPMSLPAFLITSLYSFVWYWNETSLPLRYFQESDGSFRFRTLPMAVRDFIKVYRELYPSGTVGLEGASETFNQGVQFAGTLLSILPLLIMFFIAQRWFIESIDRSGIAGS